MQQNKDEKKFLSHRDLSIFIWNKQFVVMHWCLQIRMGEFLQMLTRNCDKVGIGAQRWKGVVPFLKKQQNS